MAVHAPQTPMRGAPMISPRASRLVVIDHSPSVPVIDLPHSTLAEGDPGRGAASKPDSTLTSLAPRASRRGCEPRFPLASVSMPPEQSAPLRSVRAGRVTVYGEIQPLCLDVIRQTSSDGRIAAFTLVSNPASPRSIHRHLPDNRSLQNGCSG